MSIAICQLTPVFAGEVSGVDVTKPLGPDEVAAIEAGCGSPIAEARASSSTCHDLRGTSGRTTVPLSTLSIHKTGTGADFAAFGYPFGFR